MQPNQREIQRQLMTKYNIIDDGPIDSITNPQWPTSCNQVFHDIRQLGKVEYETYHATITAYSSHAPWRIQAKVRAESIRERVKQCIDARKNEISWRLAIETRIMARFDTEIAWGRLWRSEQEVTSVSDSANDDDYNSLKARQTRRQPCMCSSNDSARDIFEQGMSHLFDDKADEAIIYPPELLAELPKREERPDRIYGLKATKRFRRLLGLVPGTRTTPFKPDGEPIIFPFLVVEAKSEKAGCNFSDIQIQTSFVIRELLSIQQGLAAVAEEGQDWDAGPLVWSLSYMGEQWRVSAAYTQGQGDGVSYHLVRLWHGCIDSLEDALRLLLIIDYIADWARDLYREGIARGLRKLADCDSSSLARDEDLVSLSGNMGTWFNGLFDTNRDTVRHVQGDPLHEFDTEAGVFRDPRFVRSKCLGLVITHNNVEEFLRTESTNKAAGNLISRLIGNLKGACRMTGRLLNELELLWTDNDWDLSDIMQPEEIFYVVATTAFYLNSNWESVRELSYLAVSQKLISDSVRSDPEQLTFVRELEKACLVERIDVFANLLKMSAEDNLGACQSKFCLRTDSSSRVAGGVGWKLSTEDPSNSTTEQTVLRLCSQPSTRDFIMNIHSIYTVGRNELKMPFLRTSSAMDIVAMQDDLRQRPDLLRRPWPWPSIRKLSGRGDTNQQLLFVRKLQTDTFPKTTICIFVLRPSLAKTGIPSNQFPALPKRHTEEVATSDCGFREDKEINLFASYFDPLNLWNLRIRPSENTIIHKTMLNRFVATLKIKQESKAMSKWHKITTGWAVDQVLQSFEFPANRPFNRQVLQSSLGTALLKVETLGDLWKYYKWQLPKPELANGIARIPDLPPFLGDTITRDAVTCKSLVDMLRHAVSTETRNAGGVSGKRNITELESVDQAQILAAARRAHLIRERMGQLYAMQYAKAAGTD
ncbi:hypothetical protein F52700_8062 [Fusarium sp. NRRL 52700]|nr:hypothetical protein F52700_8062 [Fusarium sp. NRRL 52700]